MSERPVKLDSLALISHRQKSSREELTEGNECWGDLLPSHPQIQSDLAYSSSKLLAICFFFLIVKLPFVLQTVIRSLVLWNIKLSLPPF